MKIVVAGARGLVGSALSTLLAESHDLVALTRDDLDITNVTAVSRLLRALRPDLIVNATVLGVDESERDPALAEAVNVRGPAAIAEAAVDIGAELVHLSTNHVFDGTLEQPGRYTQDHPPNPPNVYGRSKLRGEEAVVRGTERAYIVRTSWVFGRGKENFLSTLPRRFADGARTTVIHDMWASTTYVDDLARRIRQIVNGHRYGTYHVVNDGVCSYESFAREAASLVGVSEDESAAMLELVSESDLKREAPRPLYSPMSCLLSQQAGFEPLRHWKDALRAYVMELGIKR